MPAEVHPYFDEQGWRRAGALEPFEALGGFLEQNVQSSVASCDELLSTLTRIEQDTASTWEGTGNAFTLGLTPQSALIRCEFDDDLSCELSHAELRAVLQTWRDFIQPSESTNVA